MSIARIARDAAINANYSCGSDLLPILAEYTEVSARHPGLLVRDRMLSLALASIGSAEGVAMALDAGFVTTTHVANMDLGEIARALRLAADVFDEVARGVRS